MTPLDDVRPTASTNQCGQRRKDAAAFFGLFFACNGVTDAPPGVSVWKPRRPFIL
jgi:hypothetical protein